MTRVASSQLAADIARLIGVMVATYLLLFAAGRVLNFWIVGALVIPSVIGSGVVGDRVVASRHAPLLVAFVVGGLPMVVFGIAYFFDGRSSPVTLHSLAVNALVTGWNAGCALGGVMFAIAGVYINRTRPRRPEQRATERDQTDRTDGNVDAVNGG